MYEGLNVDQNRVVDAIVNSVCRLNAKVRMLIFIKAGTGTSRVIAVLARLIHQRINSCRSSLRPDGFVGVGNTWNDNTPSAELTS